MQAFCVHIGRGWQQQTVGCALHLVLLPGLWLSFDGWRLLLGLAALAASAGWMYWRWQQNRKIVRIDINTRGQASILLDTGVAHEALLRPDSLVWPRLLVLVWQTDGRHYRQWLTRDMTDAEAWRRLSVWMRWGRPTG